MSQKRISGEHALIYWDGHAWSVRDLGSRNGTFLGSQRLAPGLPAILALHDLVGFGSQDDSWRVADIAAPAAIAVHVAHGHQVASQDGLLFLPDSEAPELTIYRDAQGRWLAESEQGAAQVTDGQLITAGATGWRLCLPTILEPTDDDSGRLTLAMAELELGVSRDEEYVVATLRCGRLRHTLSARAHIYTLLTLARLRLQDAAARVQPSEAGWIALDELARMLNVEPLLLNTHISRMRRQIGALGIADAAHIVERRVGTGQVRIGLASSQLAIVPL